MRNLKIISMLLIAFGGLTYGCSHSRKSSATTPGENTASGSQAIQREDLWTTENKEIAPEVAIQEVVNANNKFAFDLYNNLKDKNENVFFSPYSISTAIAMAYEGARGKTAEEIKNVFHFPEMEELRNGSIEIYNKINKNDESYNLSSANALWVQKDFRVLNEFTAAIEKYYKAKAENLDFVNETEKSREIINTWVEEQTAKKIKDLIPPGILTHLTRMVITNAIYFKGNWARKFDEKNTKDEDFYLNPEKTVKVKMMNLKGKKWNYTETENMQVLELPYKGDKISMMVFLPKEKNITSMEKLIDAEKIKALKSNLEEKQVDVYLPKFKIDTKYFLNEELKKMGMPTSFSFDADFSGINGKKNLLITDVIHQAFVEVNEEGTEAAAATGVVIGLKSIQMPQEVKLFRADHPFVFIIQEIQTGNILFIGRVSNPVK